MKLLKCCSILYFIFNKPTIFLFVSCFVVVTAKGAAGKKKMSRNDKAIQFCEKNLWAHNVAVDTNLAREPLLVFRTNELKISNVKTVRSSLFKNRLGHSITSPMLFCCFTSLFSFIGHFWNFL